MEKPGELRLLQALRAAACLMVVLYHSLGQVWPAVVARWPNGSAGVDLFFVISGFVMVRSAADMDWRRFAGRRLLRIVPLYWLLTGLKLLAVLAGVTAATRPTLANAVGSFLFWPVADAAGRLRPVLPVGWTLQFEMLFYALFALALAMRVRPLLVAWPALAGLAALGFWRTAAWPAAGFFCNGMVLEFAFGMALARWRGRPGPRAAVVMAALGATGLLLLPLAGPWRFLAWGGPAALCVAAAVALEARLGVRVPRAVVAWGDESYATYLSHPFVVPALGWAAPVLGMPASLIVGGIIDRLDRGLRACLRRPRGAAPWTPAKGGPLEPVTRRIGATRPIAPSRGRGGWLRASGPGPFRRR